MSDAQCLMPSKRVIIATVLTVAVKVASALFPLATQRRSESSSSRVVMVVVGVSRMRSNTMNKKNTLGHVHTRIGSCTDGLGLGHVHTRIGSCTDGLGLGYDWLMYRRIGIGSCTYADWVMFRRIGIGSYT